MYIGTSKKLITRAKIVLSPYIAVSPANCFNGFAI